MTPPSSLVRLARHPTLLHVVAASGLFLTVVLLRTHGILDSFYLLGDQIRDWRLALGSWRDLPLAGPPSSIGGTGWGPSFYWVLWLIRHLIGPWTNNLPHAGGIGVALVQSAADAFLFVAIWRRMASPLLALGVVFFGATAPFDLALSAAIWNPPVAVALVKVTMAIVLEGGTRPSVWRACAATATVWLAVQAHSTAVFMAAPVVAAFVARELLARRWGSAARVAAAMIAVVAVLQIPLFVNGLRHPAASARSPLVVDSITYGLAHPASLRIAQAFQSVTGAFGAILREPWEGITWGALLIALAIVTTVRVRRDLALLSITVVPLVLLVGGFITWNRPFETHWCLSLTPCLVLTIGLALTSLPWRWGAQAGAIVLLVIGLAAFPGRWREAQTLFRLQEYGALVNGSREILGRTKEIRAIHVEFPLPPSTPPDVIYTMLGGRVTPTAAFGATIRADGRVRWE